MRALRYLLLLGAAGIAFFAFRDYQQTRGSRGSVAKVRPSALERDLTSRSSRWQWEQSTGDASRLMVSAEGFSQGREDGAIDLRGVELRISRGDAETFDLIRTEKAIFDSAANQLRSQAETHITLGVNSAEGGEDDPELTRIIAAEAVFDTRSGAAQTESATHFRFAGGEARSTGSYYDSAQGRFEMQSNVEVERFAASADGETTYIRAGALAYEERDGRVFLRDGVSMRRGARQVEAREATVVLEEGKLHTIFATDAVGGDSDDMRRTTFRTANLEAYYDSRQRLEKAVGEGASELLTDSASSTLRASGRRIELRYRPDPLGGDSLLDEALLDGAAHVTARPKGAGESQRDVASEAIRLQMREGGREVALLETLQPGRVELTPLGGGVARTLEAERIRALYGERSRLERLEGRGGVELASEPAEGPVLRSWSEVLDAELGPAGELVGLIQRGAFRFEQEERSGEAESAVWDPVSERLTMEGRSKIRDGVGLIDAHRIVLVEGGGRIEAQGGVSSVFQEKAGAAEADGGLFREDQPVYATAARMESDSATGVVVYEGEARLWQGRNRIEADRIRIDRQGRVLEAEGKVATLLEEVRDDGREPSLVEVAAQSLRYEDGVRRATYTAGVVLKRSDVVVHADLLVARLRPAEPDRPAGLESSEAVGGVRIQAVSGGRRAEAHTAELAQDQETVVLRGEPARAWNAAGEETRGAELTWSSRNDSLRVSGGEERAYTFRRRGR
jgi:lipopolysaccharide export system protein LptA